jgi:hypothetical protein
MRFLRDFELCFTASICQNTAYVDCTTPGTPEAALASLQLLNQALLHRRLGHLGQDLLEQAIKHGVADDLKLDSSKPLSALCVPCVHGKHQRNLFPHQASHRSTTLLGRIHSNLHQVPVPTHSGFRYWVTFIDDYSRWCTIVLLRKKSDTLAAFKTYKVFVEKQTGRQITCLNDDKGGEFIGNEWDVYMQAEGIKREHTVRATPQQNGVAERKNCTLAECITTMLNEAKLPASFWGEALQTANLLLNISPSCSVAVGKTLFKLWHGRKPNYCILRVFGCRAYAQIGCDKPKSLESKALPCLFLGYPKDYKGWKLYDPRAQSIVISRDII